MKRIANRWTTAMSRRFSAVLLAAAPLLLSPAAGLSQGTRISTKFPPAFSTFHLSFSPDGKFLICEREATNATVQTLTYVDYDANGNELGTATGALTYSKNVISTIPIQSSADTIRYGAEHFTDPAIPVADNFWPRFACGGRVVYRDGVDTARGIEELPIAFRFDSAKNRVKGNLSNDNAPLFEGDVIDAWNGGDMIRYVTSPARSEFYFIGYRDRLAGGVELFRYRFADGSVTKISHGELNSMGNLDDADTIVMAISPKGNRLAVAVAPLAGFSKIYFYDISTATPPSPTVLVLTGGGVTVTSVSFVSETEIVYGTLLSNSAVPDQLGWCRVTAPMAHAVIRVSNLGDYQIYRLWEVRVYDADTLLLRYEMNDGAYALYWADFTIAGSAGTATITGNTGAVNPQSFAVSPDGNVICYARHYLEADPNIFAIGVKGQQVLPMDDGDGGQAAGLSLLLERAAASPGDTVTVTWRINDVNEPVTAYFGAETPQGAIYTMDSGKRWHAGVVPIATGFNPGGSPSGTLAITVPPTAAPGVYTIEGALAGAGGLLEPGIVKVPLEVGR